MFSYFSKPKSKSMALPPPIVITGAKLKEESSSIPSITPEDFLAYRKSSTFSRFQELPTLLKVVREVKNLDILDMGCGIGYYSRILAEHGAKSVIGIDKSEAAATAQLHMQGKNPLPNLKFEALDPINMEFEKQFDLVLTNYSLCSVRSKEELSLMCQKIFASLKRGGRAVGIIQTAGKNTDFTKALGTGRYGMLLNVPKDIHEGDPYSVSLFGTHCERKPSLTHHWYDKDTYKNCMLESGFLHFDITSFKVSNEGIDKYGPKYWQPILANPIYGVFEAKKLF